jgi:hypothetical protein
MPVFTSNDNMHIIEMPHVEEVIALSSTPFRCNYWLITLRLSKAPTLTSRVTWRNL